MVICRRCSRKLFSVYGSTRNQSWKGFCATASRSLSSKKQASRIENLKWIQPEGFDSGLKLYNPITRSITPLILQREKQLSWYSCGPTVYDSAHIGHASTYVKNDIIRRILSTIFEIDVTMVMGITDIDDKIINKANQTGEDFQAVAKFYENEFFEDMAELNVIYPNYVSRVTSHIPQILLFVQKLIDDGFAYSTTDGSVYFDTQKYEKCQHGKLTTITSLEIDISPGSEKRHYQDFALWKGVKPNEPYWKSPWGAGAGRPGWHVECSAMASHIFGKKIDIHSGGGDLIFPHHENELAQSNAFHHCNQWVNYWLHTGLLHLRDYDVKMSKSLSNGVLISNFLEKYSSNYFRIFCLLSHYRSGLEFCEETLQKSFSVYQNLIECVRSCDAYVIGHMSTEPFSEAVINESLIKTKAKVKKALSEDFHTPLAMEALIEHVKVVNRALTNQTEFPTVRSPTVIASSKVYLENIMRSLGIRIAQKTNIQGDLTQQKFENIMDNVLQFRSEVREYAMNPTESESSKVVEGKKKKIVHAPLLNACDKLRENLSHSGVKLKDHAGKSTWVLGEGKKPKKMKN